eukprot:TRINITY_DN377_c0_g1_i5.p2 TRINITY_DN377_c0_g1~~TRINITY_DN377_c0_g1_i5.p2  ORF type:complete len:325 (-),score=81.77 TRINITY_DN377_c0_g1_i5:29-1003(-)
MWRRGMHEARCQVGEACGAGAFWINPPCDKGLVCKAPHQEAGKPMIMDQSNVCMEECPNYNCRIVCPNGYKKDKNGCETCEIDGCLEDKCSEVMCLMHCDNGFKLDKDGCETCECNKCPQVSCRMHCEEYMTDSEGCNICKCKQPDTCDPETPKCRMMCENGYVKDDNGCALCKCKEDPDCPEQMCKMLCPNGFKTGEDGCSICECADPEICPLLGCNPDRGCKEVDTDKDGCGDACECKPKFNCKSREVWPKEKKAWCCKNEGACDLCETKSDCVKSMEFEEGSCQEAECVYGRCLVTEIMCDQPKCKNGSFPAPVEGECCAF